MKDKIIKTENGHSAIMAYNSEDELFTMSYLGKGGAIVSAKTKEECLKTFEEAMGLAVVAAKLIEFGRSKNFNYEK